MRQIAMAVLGYCNENSFRMPANAGYNTEALNNDDPTQPWDWIAWHTRVDPVTNQLYANVSTNTTPGTLNLKASNSGTLYTENLLDSPTAKYLGAHDLEKLQSIFRCPSDILESRFSTDTGGRGAYRYSYAMNVYVTVVASSGYFNGTKTASIWQAYNNNNYNSKNSSNLLPGMTPTADFNNGERSDFMFNTKITSVKHTGDIIMLVCQDFQTLDDGSWNPDPISWVKGGKCDLLSSEHDAKFAKANSSGITTVKQGNDDCIGNVVFCDGHGEFMSRKDSLRQKHTANPVPDPPGY